MRRFTELLLLVACTLPLLFVNGFEALQPSIKNSSLQTDSTIRGLLVPRQFFCPSGFFICEVQFCCAANWHCCSDGTCCQPSTYCVVGTNGVIGCCPNGELCSGPVGPPTTINNPPPPPPSPTTIKPPPPPPTTNNPPPPPPPTTNNPPPPPPTTITLPAPISTSTSTTTLTTLLGGPTQSVENQIIEVSVLDVNINFSDDWILQTSSCDPSINSRSTTTGNSSFTYFSDTITSSSYFYYINVANSNTQWEVFVNGVSQNTYFSYSSGFTNCTYLNSSTLIDTQLDVSQNITVVVVGLEPESETSDRLSASDSWSLEVNMLLIQEQDSTSGPDSPSSTQNTAATSTAPLFSAAGRAQPYRPLLVTGSILLAAVISILRL